MFYKSGYLNEAIINEYDNEKSLEFCLALYNKLKESKKKLEIHYIIGNHDITGIQKIKPIIVNGKSYTDIHGTFILNNYTQKDIENKYSDYSDIKIVKLTDLEIEQLYETANKSYLIDAENILSDFYINSFEKTIQDKNNNEYLIRIIKNCDSTLLGELIQDKMVLYKEDKEIGYVKVKYSTNEIYENLYPTKSLEYINAFNINSFINKNTDPEKILKTLFNKRIIEDISNDFKKDLIEADKNIANNKSLMNYINTTKEYWNNKATVEYSFIEEEYRGLGLSQIMYFYMGKYLNNEGINFRSSVTQSELALKTWNTLKKNFPNNIEEEKIQSFPDKDSESVFFLSVSKEEDCYFLNGELKHTNSLKSFLENKIIKNEFEPKKNKIFKL